MLLVRHDALDLRDQWVGADSADIGDGGRSRQFAHGPDADGRVLDVIVEQPLLYCVLHGCVVDRVLVARFERKDKRRDLLGCHGIHHMPDFVRREQAQVAVVLRQRVPDHHAVLEDLRQIEAVAGQYVARAVQHAARGDGVGDAAIGQQA